MLLSPFSIWISSQPQTFADFTEKEIFLNVQEERSDKIVEDLSKCLVDILDAFFFQPCQGILTNVAYSTHNPTQTN